MSKLNVDTIEPRGATTLTLGASGDTVDLSNAAVTLPDSAYLANRNMIINGNFDIWQRGTSFAAIAAAAYSADRYKYYKVGAAVHTITRDTDVPTQAESGSKSNYSVKIDCTTVDSSIAAGDEVNFRQTVEGYNLQSLMGNTATLSFWVKGTKTGIHCVSFVNSGTDRSYVVEYTISVTDTWEKKTITVAFSDSGGTWDYTNGTGVIIMWSLAAGTTFHTTAGAWQTGNYRSTSNQVNACDSTSNNFFLSQVQLEVSPTATPFEHKTFGQEFADCCRYYQNSYTSVKPDVAPARKDCMTVTSWNDGSAPFPVFPYVMRAAPSVVLRNQGSLTAGKCNSNGTERAAVANEIGIKLVSYLVVTSGTANAWTVFSWELDSEL